MNKLPTERTAPRQNFPFPKDGGIVKETPPTLIWIGDSDAKEYTVRVWDSQGRTVFSETTPLTYAYDTVHWKSGKYTWEVESDNGKSRGVQSFTIAPDAVFFDRPTVDEVISGIPSERPRQLFTKKEIGGILKERERALESLERTVAVAYEHGTVPAPDFEPGVTFAYRDYFGLYREYCDRDLVATALLFALKGDKRAGEAARARLMAIVNLGTEPPMALNAKGGDEIGLSGARCLPAVYDMLYPILGEDERRRCAEVVARYGEQCYDRLLRSDYRQNPENSHVGRLPAYLGEAAIALYGEGVRPEATLREWLTFALDVFSGPFPHFGTPDGAWGEGPFYATSYTRWYLPFFSAVERFSGKSLLTRPFYMNFSDYLLHFCHPDYEIHPFGDGYWCGTDDEEWPGFFAQNPFRVYADRFGGRAARALAERLSSLDIMKLHLFDSFLPTPKFNTPPDKPELEGSYLFESGGLAALHSDFGNEGDVCLLTRATPFAFGSHRHADQGSFALFSDGVALVSPSGYYGRIFGSRHHVEWTRSTQAHNLPTIDGKGQSPDPRAVGRVIDFSAEKNTVTLELSAAYQDERLVSFKRSFAVDKDGMTMTDEIEATEPLSLDYNLHFLSKPVETGGVISLERGGKSLRITREGKGLGCLCLSDEYAIPLNEGVPEEFHVEKPEQYHASFSVDATKSFRLRMRFDIGLSQAND